MRTFHDALGELRDQTHCRERLLRGEVIVDQIYALYQHHGLDLHHPRGGQALYLQQPLFRNAPRYLARYAATVLDDGGVRSLRESMEDLAEDGGVARHAPVEFGDLRASGHPRVLAGEHVLYDRPPRRHRLSEWELRAKSRLRHLPPQLLGWIWWHVMKHTKPPPRRG